MKLEFKQLGQGLPMIILHGIFGSGENWLTVSKQLAEANSIYLVDQRNHGCSFHSEEFSYEYLVEDLARFMDEQGLPEAIIMGHSMGGKVAMNFAIKYPQRVLALIVVDIAPKQYPIHHSQILEGLNSIDLANLKNRNHADELLARYVPEADTRAFLLKNLYRNDGGGYGWRLNLASIAANIGNVGQALEDAVQADLPTLFIRGAKSRYILPEDEDEIRYHFPKASIETIENAGHWVQAEQPEAFIAVVQQFLATAMGGGQ